MPEPLGVARHVGVVGRGLDGEVDRQLHAGASTASRKWRSCVQPAELRRDRVVATRRPSRWRRAIPTSSGPASRRVVAALAVRAADRMDRRQVDDVEAHGRDVGQPPRGLGEGRGRRAASDRDPASAGTARTRRRTRARSRSTTSGSSGERVAKRRSGWRRAAASSASPLERGDPRRLRARALERVPARRAGGARRRPASALLGPGQRRLHEQAALLDLDRHGHAGLALALQPLAPRPERVAPRLDRVGVPAVAEQLDVPRPAVVVDRAHRRLAPLALVVGADEERRVEQVVAVGEDVRGDEQLVADDALDRMDARRRAPARCAR